VTGVKGHKGEYVTAPTNVPNLTIGGILSGGTGFMTDPFPGFPDPLVPSVGVEPITPPNP